MDNSPMLSTPSLRPYSVTGTFAPVTQRPSRPASHGILTFTRAPPKFHLVICLSYKQRSSVVAVFLGKSTTKTQNSPRSHRELEIIPTDSFRVATEINAPFFTHGFK